MDYELEEMSQEDGQKLTDDLQKILAKHNAEMGVVSTIKLYKRIPKAVPSPDEFLPDNGNEITKTD